MKFFSEGHDLYQHYRQLLGLAEPWQVVSVGLSTVENLVEVAVKWPDQMQVRCPKCGRRCGRYDHQKERRWRHLDTMQFRTEIVCSVPRSNCPEHGVRTVHVPWAEPHSGFTMLFERFAIDVLSACATQKAAGELLRLSWFEIHRIQKRAVERGLERRKVEQVSNVGMDEKSFRRGHNYVTVLTDIDRSRVLDVVEGRDTESAKRCWKRLGNAVETVKAVAMDMWDAYVAAATAEVPQAKIVHDKFHVSKHLNDGVDKVRKREHASLLRRNIEWLKGTKHLFLYNSAKWTEDHREMFQMVKELNLKVADAWRLKEDFNEFWKQKSTETGKGIFDEWYQSVKEESLPPMKKVADMLKKRLSRLLNYFDHPITNAQAEGFNSKIQAIKSQARGFRNFANYRTAILFHCGKLNLYPQ